MAKEDAEKVADLKGHGFSRAVMWRINAALAAGGCFQDKVDFVSTL